MATELITPNMNMPNPIPGVTPGQQWADDYYTCLNILDAHDHSSGSGVQITPSGLNINSDLSFNNTNATDLKTTRFTVQTAAPAATADKGCLYVLGVDLYYRDVSGNYIRITQSAAVAGSPGSISNLVAPASASYSSASSTFIWQSAALTAANMDAGSLILRNITASSFGLTLSPPTLASNYTITLPSLPAATKFMRMDSSGNITATIDVDNITLQISGATLLIKNLGVDTAQIAAGAVTLAKIASNAVDTAQIVNGAVTTAKINSLAVTTSTIADANVTTAKIADANVTLAKMAAASVSTSQLVNTSVTTAKLDTASVTTIKITDANVTTAKIADANVTQAKLAAMTSSSTAAPVGGILTTASSGNATSTSTSYATILSGTLVATGNRPVRVVLVADGNSSHEAFYGGNTSASPAAYIYVQARRDGTTMGVYASNQNNVLYSSTLEWIDNGVPAGTRTYDVQIKSSSGGLVHLNQYSLVAYEI